MSTQTNIDLTTWLSVKQTCEELGVYRQRIHQLIHSGHLSAVQLGGHWWIVDPESVANLRANPLKVGRPVGSFKKVA